MSIGGRALGVDLGAVRIGLALSDPSGILATPFMTLERSSDDNETIDRILEVAAAEDVRSLVIGIPKSLSASNHIAEERTRLFVETLHGKTKLPIFEVDERFTTVLAVKQLRETGHDSRSMKSKIDAMAAAQILQSYLDHHGNP